MPIASSQGLPPDLPFERTRSEIRTGFAGRQPWRAAQVMIR